MINGVTRHYQWVLGVLIGITITLIVNWIAFSGSLVTHEGVQKQIDATIAPTVLVQTVEIRQLKENYNSIILKLDRIEEHLRTKQ